MASITKRVRGKRTRYLAQIRLKGYSSLSKQFDTRQEAENWGREEEAKLTDSRDRGLLRADATRATVHELVTEYLHDPETSVRRSYADIEQLMGYWADRFGDEKVRAFGVVSLRQARTELLKQHAPSRVNRYLSQMRRCWHWGQSAGYVRDSQQWPRSLLLTEPKAKSVTATQAELEVLFRAADRMPHQFGAFIRFLVGSGARTSEALSLDWRQINLRHGDCGLSGEKTASPRRVALLQVGIDALRSIPRNISGRAFSELDQNRITWYWRRIRTQVPNRWRMHDLRHVHASLLAAAGASLVELQQQLGHKSLAMVQRYAHLAPGHRSKAHAAVDSILAGGR